MQTASSENFDPSPSKLRTQSPRRPRKRDLNAVNRDLALDQLRTQFLSNMSHELRTPLNGLIGASELMGMTCLDAEQRHYLSILKSSNDRLMHLIDDLLDLSRCLSGEFHLENTGFDLHRLIRDSVEHFEPFAARKQLLFERRIDPSLPQRLRGDAKRLSQVLHNLLSNAFKFTERGRVELVITAESGCLQVLIADSGIGFSPELGDRIFDSFYQVDSCIRRAYDGAGIGLAITRQLVQSMGGRITASSSLGMGSSFRFELPMHLEDEPEAPLLLSLAPVPEEPRILLVEDNIINQTVVRLLIDKMGLPLDVAENGLEGVERHKAQPYDMILMDVQMPVMDGLEATRAIRTFDKKVPIIALTANLMEEDRDQAFAAGMNDFLTKPLNFSKLENLLNQARFRRPSPRI